jgi:DEAD/DEAH box helicase domain-containing protein
MMETHRKRKGEVKLVIPYVLSALITRSGIRDNASVIFTNFDMLHASVLPHEELWRRFITLPVFDLPICDHFYNRFLTNLKLVAVDELHYYHGLFGRYGNIDPKAPMHTANLLFAVMSLLFCGGYGESAQPWAVSVYTAWFGKQADAHPSDRRSLFVSCSATIGQPGRHMRNMFGVEVRLTHDVPRRNGAKLAYRTS